MSREGWISWELHLLGKSLGDGDLSVYFDMLSVAMPEETPEAVLAMLEAVLIAAKFPGLWKKVSAAGLSDEEFARIWRTLQVRLDPAARFGDPILRGQSVGDLAAIVPNIRHLNLFLSLFS